MQYHLLTTAAEADIRGALAGQRIPVGSASSGNIFCLLSNQSGEIGHIIAALKAVKSGLAAFIIVERTDDSRGAKSMLSDIISCGFGQNIHVFQTAALDKDSAVRLFAELTGRNGIAVPVSSATKKAQVAVRALWAGSPLREGWLELLAVDDEPTDLFKQIDRYCSAKGIAENQPTVCVWTRQSQLAGANPQFNSSKTGTLQLIDAILQKLTIPCQVLLVGPRGRKASTLLSPAGTIILGEYWLDPPFSKLSRIEQNVLFHFLITEWRCPLVHIGMKSGQMDMLSLWGQPTVVIEDVASPTRRRTELWAAPDAIQSAAFVNRLPTKKGQVIRQMDTGTATLDAAQQDTARLLKAEPSLKRGFENDDLGQILSLAEQKLAAQTNAASASLVLHDQEESFASGNNMILYYMALRCSQLP